jgi:hypothetical protein
MFLKRVGAVMGLVLVVSCVGSGDGSVGVQGFASACETEEVVGLGQEGEEGSEAKKIRGAARKHCEWRGRGGVGRSGRLTDRD